MTRHWVCGVCAARMSNCRAWMAVSGPIRPRQAGSAVCPASNDHGTIRSSSPAAGRPVSDGRPSPAGPYAPVPPPGSLAGSGGQDGAGN